MEGLFTNRSSHRDFLYNEISILAGDVSNIYIAVAFFTESEVIDQILSSNSHIRLIVRLGFPTNPKALRKIISNKNIEIRYFSASSFHPKLYIFGNSSALVGSANLTKSALLTNQEITVSIKSNDERFSELVSLFSSYWAEANVLTEKTIDTYERILSKYKEINKGLYKLQSDIDNNIEKCEFNNIDRGKNKKSKENLFIEDYRKTYQNSRAGFNKIVEVYKSVGKRKTNDESIPLRVEIDSFISYVRDEHAKGEFWEHTELGWDSSKEIMLKNHINKWLETDWEYFDDGIVNKSYPLIKKVFSSEKSIKESSYEELVDGILVLHSFRERLRFFKGGLPKLIKEFMSSNNIDAVKNTLSFLLFNKEEDIPSRMCQVIYNPSYKLREFGQSNVQELIGWVNSEDYPVVNGRTTKILRFYGFDVDQL